MQRIASTDNLFTDGNPATGTEGTIVTADFLNAVQEEIAGAVELFGGTLDPGDNGQLGAILLSKINSLLPKRSFSTTDYIRIPDVAGGLILQWGTVSNIATGATATVTLPLTFPSAGLIALATNLYGGTIETIEASTSTTQVQVKSSAAGTWNAAWFAVGY